MAKQIILIQCFNPACLEQRGIVANRDGKPYIEKYVKDADRDGKPYIEKYVEDAEREEKPHLEEHGEDAEREEKPRLEEHGEFAEREEKPRLEEHGEDAEREEKPHLEEHGEFAEREEIPRLEELGEFAEREEKPRLEELGEFAEREEKPCLEELGEFAEREEKPHLEELGEFAEREEKPCLEELGEDAERDESSAVPSTSSALPDLLICRSNELVDSDLSHIDEPPTQPKIQAFPVSTISGNSRSFSAYWYDKFSWLEYSICRNAVFCKICRHFSDARTEGTFTRTGFKDWKHMNRSCSKHELSKAHRFALGKYNDYNLLASDQENTVNPVNQDAINMSGIESGTSGIESGTSGIESGTSGTESDTSGTESSHDHIKVVLDVLMYCAKQEIPLCGHRETDDALDKGNFLEMFKLLGKYNNNLQSRIEKLPKNASLMSPHIQNELLESATSVLLHKIKSEIHETSSTYYAVLGVECKDLSKCELVAVCIRYLHKGEIKDRAVGFVDTVNMTANDFSDKIIKVLEPLEIDPKLCVSFSFDGTSMMSGNKQDVHVILKRTFQRAVYVHCNSHNLNLVLCTASKACPAVNTFYEILNSLHGYMTDTRRHVRFLEIQEQLHPDRQCVDLEVSADSRWSLESGSVKKVLMLFDVILEVLVEFSNSLGQAKLDSQSLLHQIETKKFLFLVVTLEKLFDISDFAAKGLQSATLSVTDCINLIECLKDIFVQFRENKSNDFDKVLKLTEELMEKYAIENWDVSSSRKRKLPANTGETLVFSTLSKSSSVKSNEDLRHLWNEIIDCQITELNNRFQDNAYGVMTASAACMPTSEAFGRKESLQPLCTLYGISIEATELIVFVQHVKRSVAQGKNYPSLTEVLDSCNVDVFPNVNALLRALITLPVTTCNVERLFSIVDRIKTASKASMLTSHLQNLSLLSYERELCDSLDYDRIIDIFNSKRLCLILQ